MYIYIYRKSIYLHVHNHSQLFLFTASTFREKKWKEQENRCPAQEKKSPPQKRSAWQAAYQASPQSCSRTGPQTAIPSHVQGTIGSLDGHLVQFPSVMATLENRNSTWKCDITWVDIGFCMCINKCYASTQWNTQKCIHQMGIYIYIYWRCIHI